MSSPMVPGQVRGPAGTIALNVGRARLELDVVNTGDRPVQVGSHYHFAEANPALRFDRAAARGHRLQELSKLCRVHASPQKACQRARSPAGSRARTRTNQILTSM